MTKQKKTFVHVQYRNTFWEGGGQSFTKSTSVQLIKEPNYIEKKCIVLDLKLVQSMDVEPGYTVGEVNWIFKQNEEGDNFPVIKFFLMKFVTFYL